MIKVKCIYGDECTVVKCKHKKEHERIRFEYGSIDECVDEFRRCEKGNWMVVCIVDKKLKKKER
jgi:hypothetical protein